MTGRSTILATICAMAAAGQSGLAPPLVGLVTGRLHELRRVHGVAGNFVPGDAIAGNAGERVFDWAFSGRGGMAKTANQLLLLDAGGNILRASAAPDGNAVFAFDAHGLPALYYFAATAELWRVGAASDTLTPLDPDQFAGEVRAITLNSRRHATLTICRDHRLALIGMDLETGVVRNQGRARIPGCPALLLLPDSHVYAQSDVLVIQAVDGEEHRVKLPGPAQGLRQMGDGWIEIDLSGQDPLALNLGREGGTLFHIPRAESK